MLGLDVLSSMDVRVAEVLIWIKREFACIGFLIILLLLILIFSGCLWSSEACADGIKIKSRIMIKTCFI